MHDQIQAFLKFITVEKGYAQNTLSAYQNDLNQMSGYLKQNNAGITWRKSHARTSTTTSTTCAR